VAVRYDSRVALGIYLVMLCEGKSHNEARNIMKNYVAETKGESDADDD
jgi:hypothetical protein